MYTQFQSDPPTRTKATEALYLKRYQSLYKRFSKETGENDLDPNDVVARLMMMKYDLCMSSWRQYRTAVLFVMESRFPQYNVAIESLLAETSEGLSKKSQKTSARKIKNVPAPAWKALQTALAVRAAAGYKYAKGLLSVLHATLLTGLRPIEWCFSEIVSETETNRPILKIRNSKHTNGRANGEYRELYLDELTEHQVDHIKAAIECCRIDASATDVEIGKAAASRELALKHELESARDSTLPKSGKAMSSITLYSFRHQFIADAKATFSDPVIIAAMAGHKSTSTAFTHYGKRKNASGTIKVTPTIASIEAVLTVHAELYKKFLSTKNRSNSLSM